MDLRKKLGERLKEERLMMSLTQSAFAEAGGVKKDAQLKYESGKRSPNAEYLQKISDLGVDISYIIAGQRIDQGVNDIWERCYLTACRELPTPEAREIGLEALAAVLENWEPGVTHVSVRKRFIKKQPTIVDRFLATFAEVMAPIIDR